MSQESVDRVVLGCIIGHHGVRGWLKIKSHTRPSEEIFSFNAWRVLCAGAEKIISVKDYRISGKYWIVCFAGITTREQANCLLGADILVESSQLPEPQPGMYYWRDLIGLQVQDVQGEIIGNLKGMLETGANDVAVVARDANEDAAGDASQKEILIPWIAGVIIQVDIADNKVIVEWDDDF